MFPINLDSSPTETPGFSCFVSSLTAPMKWKYADFGRFGTLKSCGVTVLLLSAIASFWAEWLMFSLLLGSGAGEGDGGEVDIAESVAMVVY